MKFKPSDKKPHIWRTRKGRWVTTMGPTCATFKTAREAFKEASVLYHLIRPIEVIK